MSYEYGHLILFIQLLPGSIFWFTELKEMVAVEDSRLRPGLISRSCI